MKTCAAVARIIALGLPIAITGHAAAQQTYPSKPIRMIVPYAPGGSVDLLARLIGQRLTENWGQPVIVENRSGANTIIGSEALAKSRPDGYTVMAMSSTFVTTALLSPTPFDPIKDFAPIATLTSTELVLVLHPSVPANSLGDFIALAKSRPGELNFGSPGSGTVTHVQIELFNIVAGIKTQHIPYNGAGPLTNGLIGGQVQMSIQAPITTLPHIKSGRLKPLAVTGASRLSALPQVPTFAEAGLPGFDVRSWFGILAPAAAPKEIVDRLSKEFARMLLVPEFKEKLASQGMDPFSSDAVQFAALLKADMARYAKVIKTANIKAD